MKTIKRPPSEGPTMVSRADVRRPSDRHLGYAAAALSVLVAVLHLFHPSHGFVRLVVVVGTDPSLLVVDPRPLGFVAAAVALLLGVNAALAGVSRTPLYLAGMALTAALLVGYFGWHLSGHGGFLPGREPLYHGMAPIEAVVSHLIGDPWAAAAKLSEAALFGVLAALYRRA